MSERPPEGWDAQATAPTSVEVIDEVRGRPFAMRVGQRRIARDVDEAEGRFND